MRAAGAVAILVGVMTIGVVPVASAIAVMTVGRAAVFIGKRRAAQALEHAAEAQPHFGGHRPQADVTVNRATSTVTAALTVAGRVGVSFSV